MQSDEYFLSILAPNVTSDLPTSTFTLFGDGSNGGEASFDFSENLGRVEFNFFNIVNPDSEEFLIRYSINNQDFIYFPSTQGESIVVNNPQNLYVIVGSTDGASLSVSISSEAINQECSTPNTILLLPDSGLYLSSDTDLEEAQTVVLDKKFDGSFNQSGDTTESSAGETDSSFVIDLDIARIAKEKDAPNFLSTDTTFNMNFNLSISSFGQVSMCSGNLIVAPYANVYTIINQTSLQQIPPTLVGTSLPSLDTGSITIDNVVYIGTILSITFRVNLPTLWNDYDISGTISWRGSDFIG